jgi:uncharacterized repeat protein (TIGR01451 family)
MFKKICGYFYRCLVFNGLFVIFFFVPMFNPRLCFGGYNEENTTTFKSKIRTDNLFSANGEKSELILDIDTNLLPIFPLNDAGNQPRPYLFLDKLDKNSDIVNGGEEYGYEIIIANRGNVSFYDIVVKDVIPGGFVYTRGSSQVDGVAILEPVNTSGQLIFKIGELPSYSKKTLNYKVKVINNTVDGNYYSLTRTVGKYLDPATKEVKFYEGKDDVSDVTVVREKYYTAKVSSEVLGTSVSRTSAGEKLFFLSLLLGILLFVLNKKVIPKVSKSLPMVFVISVFYLFIFPGSAKAASDMVLLQDLPEYVNTNSFKLSYTALSDSPVNAKFYVKKDGDMSWHQFAWRLGHSGWVQVSEPSVIYSGDGRYLFKVEINDGLIGDESVIIVDRTLPKAVSGFKSEKIDDTYKLSWRNPDIDDFYKVFIYRSTTRHFTADNSTKVGEVGGERNAEVVWKDNSDRGKDYYYALRVIDKAGNASGPVSDPRMVIVAGESASTSNSDEGYISPERKESNLMEVNSPKSRGDNNLPKMIIIYISLLACVTFYVFYERKKFFKIEKKRRFYRKNR